MGTDKFIVYIKTDYDYKDIAEYVKRRFDIPNNELERSVSKGKNKRVIELTKDKLSGKMMTKFVGLRTKNDSYLTDDGKEDKKVKGTEICFIKRKFKFQDYKNCVQATQLENKINYIEKIDKNSIKENHKKLYKTIY